jgi:hypothetical protein
VGWVDAWMQWIRLHPQPDPEPDPDPE